MHMTNKKLGFDKLIKKNYKLTKYLQTPTLPLLQNVR